MDIQYLTGDATTPSIAGNKIIVHVCNDIGAWGKGFVLALSQRWTKPESEYRQAFTDGNTLPLGQIQLVPVSEDTWVCNLIGQHGIRSIDDIPPVRYEAIYAGLTTLAPYAIELSASIHMPRIGCGLAGGRWDRIQPLLHQILLRQNIPTFVYDLPS